MKFCVIYQQTSHNAQSPIRVVEQTTGREVGWINRYLDREYVRRLANTTLCTYAFNLLHFIRWWESVHYTGDIREGDLTESTLLDYEYVRRLANTTLCTYAFNLLHFIRWWESVHYTGDIREGDLTESTLLD